MENAEKGLQKRRIWHFRTGRFQTPQAGIAISACGVRFSACGNLLFSIAENGVFGGEMGRFCNVELAIRRFLIKD